ncbi:MAG: biopolymer transporter ExbD [Pseudomonadales bacterium]|nr:biopolymer transporter ExbD [Pseudomonadales bacterium]
MRRPFGRGREDEGDNQINLTPMLDVVFIMLIFFIVTATFVKEVGLDVNQPDDDKPKTVDPDKKSIVVRISNRDRIVIAQRDVDWRAVRANIERLHAENPEAPVIIQPHPDSTTEAMIHVMDSARQAGVYNVSLAAAN